MPDCNRVGRSPEVDDASTDSGGRAASASASNFTFNSSRSGALSCAKIAPSQASATEAAKRTEPKFSGQVGCKFIRARRAFSRIRPVFSGASGAGS